MKKITTGLFALLCSLITFEAYSATERANIVNINGRCVVYLTTIYEYTYNTYTEEMSCEAYYKREEQKLRAAQQAEERRERQRIEAEEERQRRVNQEIFEKELKVKVSELFQMGLIEPVANLQENDKWYPDKTRRALITLSEGKTVAGLSAFLDEYGKYPLYPGYIPLNGLSIHYLITYLQQKGYGTANILGWTNRPFDFCGNKTNLFVIELEHGDKVFKTGIVWSFDLILEPKEINRVSAKQTECLSYFD